jgi:hypothetical protein
MSETRPVLFSYCRRWFSFPASDDYDAPSHHVFIDRKMKEN